MSASTPPVTHPVVTTASGPVRGTDDGRVAVWKGIRFAEPPVGDLRWRAAVAAAPWTDPVDALAFAPAAPQTISPAVNLGPDPVLDEDCLFLNVWAPSGGPADTPRPVMVWVHGGAYTFGSTAQAMYDATSLIDAGAVIVVTVAYRLGTLGFLDLSSWSTPEDEYSANPALTDVILALAWVRDSIAAFGGDPDAVTVFGESAGGGIVTALLAVPSARDLFARAIIQSSPATSIYGTARSRQVAEAVFARVGVAAGDLTALRALDVDTLVHAGMAVYADVPSEHPGTLAFAPVVDGVLLPEHPIAAVRAGRGHPGPVLIGTNRDEATLFRFMKSPLLPITEAAITEMLTDIAREDPAAKLPTRAEIMETYEGVRHKLVGLGIATDIGFRMPAVWLAEGHSRTAPTYLYRFDFTTPMLRLLGIGAAHATELPYTWGNLDGGPKDPAFRLGGRRKGERVSARTMQRWLSFARTGDPSLPESVWDPFTEEARWTLLIDAADVLVEDPDARIRAGWGEEVLAFE